MSENYRSQVMSSGRIGQKARTRSLLLAAARDQMSKNSNLTVATVAAAAGISTATAYRYFSDPEALKLEAILALDMGDDGAFLDEFSRRTIGLGDPVDRVVEAHRIMVDFVRRNEAGYRLFIAKGHEQIARAGDVKTQPRGNRRVPLIEMALSPAKSRLGDRFNYIVQSVAAACGPEPYFVLKDVFDLSEEQIDDISEANLRRLTAVLLVA